MIRKRRALIRASVLALATGVVIASPASAQMRVDVSGVGASQYPIAVADFAATGQIPRNVAEVVRSDLSRSGAFRLINPGVGLNESSSIDFIALRTLGADAVLAGSMTRITDGRYDVRYRLSDAVRQASLGGESLLVGETDLRLAGHRIADWVYEKITGEKGIFSTRIAFVSRQGKSYRLNIADWDGENVQTALTSPEPIISPSWSPDGTRLAYVSFESRKPVVYVHDLASGKRTAVANFRGSNSAPAWSPDSRMLAVALTRDGLSQVYLVPADGKGQPRRLTSSAGIDTEPRFTPDGASIFFTSDRGGSPQIYRMSPNGGDPVRITFGSSYNVSPRISPDGKIMAYITRREGRYLVALKDLSSGVDRIISDGGREEAPSFAPNGRWVMYATQAGGRDSLMAVSIDGRVKQRLTSNAGDIREPTWGPMPR